LCYCLVQVGDQLKERFERWRDLCRDKYHGDSPLDTALNRQVRECVSSALVGTTNGVKAGMGKTCLHVLLNVKQTEVP
jgi:hypothetical protein